MYLARNKNNELWLMRYKPELIDNCDFVARGPMMMIDTRRFQDVTFENSPIMVDIFITKQNKKENELED